MSIVSAFRCQVEVSAPGWSRVQRSPTECGVSECESWTSRRPWPTGGCCAVVKSKRVKWILCDLHTNANTVSVQFSCFKRLCAYTFVFTCILTAQGRKSFC